MSPKKPRSNVAQRVSKYKSNNPDKKKSNKMKEHLTFLKKRLADDKFNEEVKKKQRERKQKQRAAKKMDLAALPTHHGDSVTPDRLVVRFPFQSMQEIRTILLGLVTQCQIFPLLLLTLLAPHSSP